MSHFTIRDCEKVFDMELLGSCNLSNSIFMDSYSMGRVESHSNDLLVFGSCTIVKVDDPVIEYVQTGIRSSLVGVKRRFEEVDCFP